MEKSSPLSTLMRFPAVGSACIRGPPGLVGPNVQTPGYEKDK